MVTGDRSAFRSVAIPARKNGRITAPATSAAAHAAAISESVSGVTSARVASPAEVPAQAQVLEQQRALIRRRVQGLLV